MARFVRTNRAQSTLTVAIDDNDLTATVASIGSFPVTIAGDQFPVLLDAGLSTEELTLCTSVAGSALTLTRGTPAYAHAIGATVTYVESKDSLENIASYVKHADGVWLASPPAQTFDSWNYDPAFATAGSAPSVGVQQLCRIDVPDDADISISSVCVYNTNVCVGGAASFVGIFSSAGALLATSADQTTWGGAIGLKTVALIGAPYVRPAGSFVWGALLIGTAGGTPAQFARRSWAASGVGNVGLTGVNCRAGSNGSGLSVLTAFTPAAGVPAPAVSTEFWMAVI